MYRFKEDILSIPIFMIIKQIAEENNKEIFVVGGYVRDLFLGRTSKDIDFVCLGSGVSFAEKVAQALGKESKLSIFKNFGTAAIHYKEYMLEFVGARKESYSHDSRKPIVEKGTFVDDQNRRDFTINAMSISLNKESFGELIDPFNGQKDLERKVIKTPLDPDIIFSDDPLRMMRAVRFASQLQFDIDAETFQGIINNVSRIEIISKERMIEELNKIILSKTPSYGFKLLFHSGLLKQIFPKMVNLHGVETVDNKKHKDNFYHTLQVLDNVSRMTENLWLRWAAILHDIAKPATKCFNKKAGWTFHGHEDLGARWVPKIFKQMKLPLDERMKYVQKLVRLHLRPIALVNEKVTDSAIRRMVFEAGEDIDDLMLLCRADITSKNSNKRKQYLKNFDKVEQKVKEVEKKDSLKNFQPPISGEQIMQTFNLRPSKIVGQIKHQIKEAILEGQIPNDKQKAFDLMLEIGKQMRLSDVKKNNILSSTNK